MVSLPQTYNVDDEYVQGGSGEIVHIKDGIYKAVILTSDLQDNSKRNGKFLKMDICIVEGEYADTVLVERFNIINPNDVAVQIAYKQLASIAKALGMSQTPADSNELHNKPLLIDVKTEKGTTWKDKDGNERDGKDKSVIKKYLPLSNAPSKAGAVDTSPPVPWG